MGEEKTKTYLTLPLGELSVSIKIRRLVVKELPVGDRSRCYEFRGPGCAAERDYSFGIISGILEPGNGWCSKLFLFGARDCFDPPLYLVADASFAEAYETYCANDVTLRMDASEVDDNVDVSASGHPINTDNVFGFEVALVSVEFQH